jgi:hypothetical protein
MKLITLFSLLSVFSLASFGSEMNVFECSQKATSAATALAELEFGKDILIIDQIQSAISTEIEMEITFIHKTKPSQLVYVVKTLDISDENLCVIESVTLK